MKILMCSDGSQQSECAIRYGAAIAAGCQAEVTLLGINETPGHKEPLLASLQRSQAFLEEKKISAELITKSGDPLSEIVKRTTETQYDLIIIGAVRKELRGGFWMSSKAYRIIKAVKPPVLTVVGQPTSIKHALICTGGKRYIDDAVRLTGQIAHGVKAAATLLHVIAEPPALYAHLRRVAETTDQLLKSNSELGLNLRHEKEILESLGVQAQVRLRRGPVLEEILGEMQSGQYDLVVTGSAVSHSLRTYVLGDVTREILNQAGCAVLVVRTQTPSALRAWFPGW